MQKLASHTHLHHVRHSKPRNSRTPLLLVPNSAGPAPCTVAGRAVNTSGRPELEQGGRSNNKTIMGGGGLDNLEGTKQTNFPTGDKTSTCNQDGNIHIHSTMGNMQWEYE
jgi:hypothetical protein